MKKRLSILGLFFGLAIMLIGVFGITVFALESEGVYTITYHLDGGTNAVKNPDVYTAEDIIELKDATKDGYTFDGWYLDASKTNKITEISGRTGNINLYAKFSPKSYTATFNDEIKLTVCVPGFEDKIYYVPYGTSVDPYSYSFMRAYLPSDLNNSTTTRYNKDPRFSGWYVKYSGGTKTKISGSLNINTDTTIVCDFNKEIQDSYYLDHNELSYGTENFQKNIGFIGNLLVPTMSNGKFSIILNVSATNYHSAVYIRNRTTRDVYCDKDSYNNYIYNETITINANPGDVIEICVSKPDEGYITICAPGRVTAPLVSKKNSKATVYYDNMVDVPQPSSREGYVFVGWEDKNGNIFDGSKWTYLESMTFVPKFQPRKYSIKYELDGGVNNISNPSDYTIEDTVTLQAPSKTGYTFDGWFSDKALTIPVEKISDSTGDLTLYAKFSVNTYDLYLDGAGGSFSPKVVFVSEGQIIRTEYLGESDSIEAYRPGQREGYIFGGWYKDETLKSAFKFTGTISDDITLYAKWIECDSDIIYPEIIEIFNATINGKTEKYYAFVPLNDGTVKVTSDSDNLDLYGILYNSTKGILTQADDISDSDLDFSFSYNVKANQLYYICVKGNTASTKGDAVINITFSGNTVISGTTYANREIEVAYGNNFSLPDLPVKEGYFFLGWYDETDTQVTNGKWEFISNKILTAKWREKTPHTITFKDENGQVLAVQDYLYGDVITPPKFPIKEADQTYTYDAQWNNDYSGICVGDVIYTVEYTPVYIDYSVVFKDANGTVLSSQAYHYGDAVTAPQTPTKAADNTYTYTFAGWDKSTVPCAGNATYTATYKATYIDYTVEFKDYDGNTISSKIYHYGDVITVPANPEREADNTYTYVFAGWDKSVISCAGNATYTATYKATYIDYTVLFKDYNGKVLSRKNYHYGDAIAVPSDPTRSADNTYTYVFAGWDTSVTSVCGGSATYTATYTPVYINYTVVFKDYNGKIIISNTYHYGDEVTAPKDPTRETDVWGSYTFKAWDREIVDCVGDATYTATYDVTYTNYTVTFKNWNGDVISTKSYHYGDTIITPADPTREADKTYTYSFAGWDRKVVACDGEKIYTATFIPVFIEYTVVFKDWNGNVISSKEYHYGQSVTKPNNPTRDADNTYTYAFAGWDKTVTSCTESTVYTATYSSTYIEYEVVFKNYDGTILSTNKYHYGDTVAAPEAPTKPADESYTYGFAGWDSEVTACLGNKTYTATFNPTNVEYTVVFKDWNGNIISSETYYFGAEVVVPENPTRNADNIYTYTFKNWGKTVAENCVGDAEYTAVYEATYIEYNIKFLDWDGSVIQTVKYHFGDTITAIADPERASDETYTYTFLSWNKPFGTCTGNASFTAQYESTFIDYTVVFKDYDGSVISRKTYHFGDTITIPADPVRASDETYTYTFKDWGSISTSCNGNKEYTAVYNSEYIEYTVVFKDHNGDTLSSKAYHYGDEVVVPSDPTRVADNTYTYAFAGWDKEIVDCVADATYTATYDSTYIDYTVIFKNEDGTVLSTNAYHYGDEVIIPAMPTKEADNTYTYAFKAWDKTVVDCAGDATYTATYDSTYIDYTVIFKNEDGTVLSTNAYHYGDEVIAPADPAKESDSIYNYTFAGWDTEVVTCAGNATYTATYISTEIEKSETTETTESETTEATELETTETTEFETIETTESETTEPATKETTEVETNGQMDNKPGCGGSISGSSVVFVALISLGALQLTKKKKQD